MNKLHFFRTVKNRRRINRKSRRASKRSRRRSRTRRVGQRGGDWAFHIDPRAIVGRKNEEGVEGFKTMKEVLEEKETGTL